MAPIIWERYKQMPMKKTYYTVGGELIGEKTTGGTRTDYLTDALGSVTATLNQSAQIVNTYRYKPYGALLAKTGTGADPAYTWVGSKGYRQTGNQFSDTYVRARTYSSTLGRWTTTDPIKWRGGDWNYYGYVHQRPTVGRDPSGLVFDPWSCTICAGILGGAALGLLLECGGDPRGFATCVGCLMRQNPFLTGLLIGGTAIACSICIPQLGPIIGRIGGQVGAPAFALASSAGTGISAFASGMVSPLLRDPCNPTQPRMCPPRGGETGPDVEGPPIDEPAPWERPGQPSPFEPDLPGEPQPRVPAPYVPPFVDEPEPLTPDECIEKGIQCLGEFPGDPRYVDDDGNPANCQSCVEECKAKRVWPISRCHYPPRGGRGGRGGKTPGGGKPPIRRIRF